MKKDLDFRNSYTKIREIEISEFYGTNELYDSNVN